ncbi:MAG: BamA/TamA family outer membrane protein [candidate division Zixibacteria bacterium]|nr:BamA/TamA family outer membrane protein [candidate division Zixibacteria bacterium]
MIRFAIILLLIAGSAYGGVTYSGVTSLDSSLLLSGCKGSENLELCLQTIVNSYIKAGFHNVSINLEVKGTDTLVQINEGRRYLLSDLIVSGVEDSVTTLLLSTFDQSEPLTISLVDRFAIAVVRFYAENGYPFAKLEIRNIAVDGSTINLDCRLIKGPRTTVGQVSYSGLRLTLPSTLDSRVWFSMGKLYRETDLERSLAALSRVKFCRLTNKPAVIFNQGSEQVDIDFPMVDSRNIRLSGALYLLPDSKLAGTADVSLQNLLGGGRELTFAWSKRDAQSQQLVFALLLPYFSGYPLDVNLALAQEDCDSSYISMRAQVGIDYRLNTSWRAGLDLSWEKITPEEDKTTPSARILSVGLISSFDSRDDIFRTLNGALLRYRFLSSYRRSFAENESSGGYATELDADMRLWRRLGGALSLLGRLHTFQIRSDFDPIPRDQLLPIGGGEMLRGYREESYLARLGVLTTLELRWFATDRLMLCLFTDNGYLETNDNDFALTGFGTGLSVMTTLGSIRFDLSLGEEKSLDKLLVHFGFAGKL